MTLLFSQIRSIEFLKKKKKKYRDLGMGLDPVCPVLYIWVWQNKAIKGTAILRDYVVHQHQTRQDSSPS